MSKTFGLGKGLGSLIPGHYNKTENFTAPALGKGEKIQEVEVEKISSNPHQPRQDFGTEQLEDLAASIKEHGVLQPLIVSALAGGEYQLIVGERRLRAVKIAGLTTVPVIVREVKEQHKLEMALIENLQRQDLNVLEEATAYQRLLDEFNLTHEEIAKKVGKSRPVVSNLVRLLKLPEHIKQAILTGKISPSHAKIMAGLEGKELEEFYNKVVNQRLTVAEAEKVVRKVAVKKHFRSITLDPQLINKEEELRNLLGTKVEIKKTAKGSGQIIIHYYSAEELNKILEQLKGFRV